MTNLFSILTAKKQPGEEQTNASLLDLSIDFNLARSHFDSFITNPRNPQKLVSELSKAAEKILEISQNFDQLSSDLQSQIKKFTSNCRKSASARVLYGSPQESAESFEICYRGLWQEYESLRAQQLLDALHLQVGDTLDPIFSGGDKTNLEFAELCETVGSNYLRGLIAAEVKSRNPELSIDSYAGDLVSSLPAQFHSNLRSAALKTIENSSKLPLSHRIGLMSDQQYRTTRAYTNRVAKRSETISFKNAEKRAQIEEFKIEIPATIKWPSFNTKFIPLLRAIRANSEIDINEKWIETVAQSIKPQVTEAALTSQLKRLFQLTTEVNFELSDGEKRPILLSCRMLVALIKAIDRAGVSIPYTTDKGAPLYYSFNSSR